MHSISSSTCYTHFCSEGHCLYEEIFNIRGSPYTLSSMHILLNIINYSRGEINDFTILMTTTVLMYGFRFIQRKKDLSELQQISGKFLKTCIHLNTSHPKVRWHHNVNDTPTPLSQPWNQMAKFAEEMLKSCCYNAKLKQWWETLRLKYRFWNHNYYHSMLSVFPIRHIIIATIVYFESGQEDKSSLCLQYILWVWPVELLIIISAIEYKWCGQTITIEL